MKRRSAPGQSRVSEFDGVVNPLPVALFPNCPDSNDDQWKRLMECLKEAGRKTQARNRKLCYHPHLGTGVMKTEAIHHLMDTTEPHFVHMLLDAAHQTAAGVNALALSRKYTRSMKHIHLKDIRRIVADRIRPDWLSFHRGIGAGMMETSRHFLRFSRPCRRRLYRLDLREGRAGPGESRPTSMYQDGRAYLARF